MSGRHPGRSLVASALAAVFVVSCGGDDPGPTTVPPTPIASTTTSTQPAATDESPLRGFSLSPLSYESDDFLEFLDVVSANGDALAWVGDAAALSTEESPMVVLHSLEDQYDLVAIGVGGVSATENGQLLRPIDDETFASYVEGAGTYAETYSPPFFGYGVEVDSLFHADPDGFDRYVELFEAVAARVREASPDTQMLVVFQLERMKGLNGGLFGGVNDESQAIWHLLDRFPSADIIGFSTYPALVFESPDDMPDDYYRGLAEVTGGRPVAFTEMGWHAEGDYGPYSGSDEAQARFVHRFVEMIVGLDVAFYTWSFLFDQAVVAPFDTMGLFRTDGTARPGWEEWVSAG